MKNELGHRGAKTRESATLAKVGALQGAMKQLSSGNTLQRASAAAWLGQHRSRTAIPSLLKSLRDTNGEVRMRAVESLRMFPDDNGTILLSLRPLLRDREELVRIEVAFAMGAIGSNKALPWLRSALKDRSPLVRSYVAGALGILGDRFERVFLLKLLASERSATAMIGYFSALYNLGIRGALVCLVGLGKTADYRLRISVANNVRNIVEDGEDRKLVLSAIPLLLANETEASVRDAWNLCRRKFILRRSRSK